MKKPTSNNPRPLLIIHFGRQDSWNVSKAPQWQPVWGTYTDVVLCPPRWIVVTLLCRWGNWGRERLHCEGHQGSRAQCENRTVSSSEWVKLSKLLSLAHLTLPPAMWTSDSVKLACILVPIVKPVLISFTVPSFTLPAAPGTSQGDCRGCVCHVWKVRLFSWLEGWCLYIYIWTKYSPYLGSISCVSVAFSRRWKNHPENHNKML